MNYKSNQPNTSEPGKAPHTSMQSDIGQADTKEITLLASGLIILTLGLGGLFMYSADEPLPATASQDLGEEVSPMQMAKAFVTPTPSSTLPTSHEALADLAEQPSLQVFTNFSESQDSNDADVYFGFNQWTLSDKAKFLIKTKVDELAEGWEGSLLIDGHTDTQGPDAYNQTLGLRRAESVKTYLLSLGISEDRIQVHSFGKDGAICQEHTQDCFEDNRRAHVAFLSQPPVQQEDALLSMAPDALEGSTHVESSPVMDSPSIEVSEGDIALQEEIPGEQVAVDSMASAESLP